MTTADRIYHHADRTPEGWQERIGYRIDSATFARERGEAVGALYRYWKGRAGCGPPKAGDFDPLNDLSREITGLISYVDLNPNIRHGWIFNHHANTSKFAKFEHRAIADYPILDHRTALLQEYDSVRYGRAPRFDEIVQEYGRTSRHYKRLILPVADENSDISRLWIVTRLLSSSFRPGH